MGISGSGKSTVAALLASQLGWDVQEGDDLHPAASIAKMAAGHPLTDEDRWPWLDRVAAWITDHTDSRTPGIITCSALKRAYRDRLRGTDVIFVHLRGSREQIGRRLAARSDHFMPAALLDSQISTLEAPEADEATIVVDVAEGPAAITARIVDRLELTGGSVSAVRGDSSPPVGAYA